MSSHRSALADLLKAMYGRSQAVYVHLPLLDVVGGWPAAIVFSHLAFWCERYERPIYKSAPELGDELRMGERTVERSVAHLRKLGILVVTTKRAKGAPTNHYSIDYEKLADLFREIDPANEAGTDPANEAGTLTEGNTNRRESKPSSTFVDVSASKSTSSTRNEAESPSSLKGVDLAASSARAHANKETSPASQVAAVIEIWNSNCGLARKTRKPTEKLERQVGAYIRAMKKNGDDPVAVMAFMAAEVAREGFYDRKYGLGNLLAGTNWEPRYQAYLESLETGTHSLAVGQRVSWLSNPSMPFSRRYYGHVSELLEDGAVAIQAEPNQPGLHYNPSRMNPERLTVEDE